MSDHREDMMEAAAFVIGEMEAAHRQTRWLHLPSRFLWINPAQIARVFGWHAEGDPSRIVSYSLYMVGDDLDNDGIEADVPADVAAVTAWLEART